MRFRAASSVFLAAFAVLAACRGQGSDTAPPAPRARETPAAAKSAAPAPTRAAAHSARPRIIVLGDSLSAGLGLDVEDSFPSLIQGKLDRQGADYEVVNAGVSGDTSAGGLRRLDWALGEGDPKILIVALGGNDGLRGLPPEQLESNLGAIVERAQKRGVTVILAGMEAPPNFGEDYTTRFRAVYPALAKRFDVPLIPFLLEGVAGNPSLNQSDGIHPNKRGAEMVADLVWKTLEPAVAEIRPASPR